MACAIPDHLQITPLHTQLEAAGLKRVHQGKVRDTYALPMPDVLALVATDRLSIFDFVLPVTVPGKGERLTALSVFWFKDILTHTGIKHHLLAAGPEIDYYLPPPLRHNAAVRRRMMVVKALHIIPVECIVRGYLTGSGWRSYQQTGRVHGIRVGDGLYDGARLADPVFDPTTKEEAGHDQPLPAEAVSERHGIWLQHFSLDCYRRLARVALEVGNFILADTKFEFGEDRVLADEVGTPDSSRFWDGDEYDRMRQKRMCPTAYDKEFVRKWGMHVTVPASGGSPDKIGIHHLDPLDAADVAAVHQLEVPDWVICETQQRYHTVCQRLLGMPLAEFQKQRLGA